ncbi:MAG: hypothetical protein K6U75_04170 [Firmicutes bacterium]|nr:hypothetical protein [Bacillota bacterium]
MKGNACDTLRGAVLTAVLMLLLALTVEHAYQLRAVWTQRKFSDSIYTYSAIMQRSLEMERRGHYKEAIDGYLSALPHTGNLPSDLSLRAQIAVYNRIGACYLHTGDLEGASQAFRKSADLGDTKYAPSKLAEIKSKLSEIQREQSTQR